MWGAASVFGVVFGCGPALCRYTLHPRTKGFWICLDALRGSIDEVWDVALGYEGRIAQNEAAMVWRVCRAGAFPVPPVGHAHTHTRMHSQRSMRTCA